jgi:hypothetical protein
MDQERFRVAAIATPRSQLFFVSDVSRPVPDDSDTLLTLGVEFVRTAWR